MSKWNMPDVPTETVEDWQRVAIRLAWVLAHSLPDDTTKFVRLADKLTVDRAIGGECEERPEHIWMITSVVRDPCLQALMPKEYEALRVLCNQNQRDDDEPERDKELILYPLRSL